MSAVLLTILRLGFLVALWWFVFTVITVLRRDLQAPRDAKPLTPARTPTRRANLRPAKRGRGAPAALVIVAGPLTGTEVPLGHAPIVIGRAPDSNLVLNDDYVSSHHARLRPDNDRWVIEDIIEPDAQGNLRGPTNGTEVNGHRITGPTLVARTTQVKVGETILELR